MDPGRNGLAPKGYRSSRTTNLIKPFRLTDLLSPPSPSRRVESAQSGHQTQGVYPRQRSSEGHPCPFTPGTVETPRQAYQDGRMTKRRERGGTGDGHGTKVDIRRTLRGATGKGERGPGRRTSPVEQKERVFEFYQRVLRVSF